MATLGSHVGNVKPGMESTPVKRTTDSSSVDNHYADLGKIPVEEITQLHVTKEQMEKFLVRAGTKVWLTGNGEECLDRVMDKKAYRCTQYGPHEVRVHLKNKQTFRMVMSEFKDYVYFEPKAFGQRMMQTIDSCDVE